MINLIGISGKSGSGKNTVAEMIQYFTEHPDQKRSFNSFKIDVGCGSGAYLKWQQKQWAAGVKQVASLLTGIPVEKFEDQEFKKSTLGPEWNYRFLHEGKGELVPQFMTVREMLQKIGTDCMRNNLHPNTWVNALMSEYRPLDDIKRASMGNVLDYSDCPFPKWLITDTRFPNEAQAIKDRGGVVIRVERPGMPSIGQHPSEIALDDWTFDYVIENNGTLDELMEEVKIVLQDLKIIP